jgi:MFS family permease
MGRPQERSAGVGRLVALNGLWLGFNLQTSALLPVVVPAQVLLLVGRGEVGSVGQAAFLGWLGAAGSLAALVMQPLVGHLSDRYPTRLGRRLPYVAAGVVLAVVGAAGLAAARSPLLFGGAFVLLMVGNNAAMAAYQALLPEHVPAARRGVASGFLGVMQIVGNAASLGLALLLLGSVTARDTSAIASGATTYVAVTSVGVVACAALVLLAVRERPPAAGVTPPPPGTARYRNYAWVFAARSLVMMGLMLFMAFIEYYFAQVARVTNFVQATAVVALIALAVATVGAVGLGAISDRTRRVPLAFAASLTMAAAAVLFLVPGAISMLWLLGGLFGLGYGAYMSVDWALAVDSLPAAGAVGRDLGIWSLATTLPGMAAPALGAGLIAAVAQVAGTPAGYRAVFVAAMVFFVAGAVAVLGIRERRRDEATSSPAAPPC